MIFLFDLRNEETRNEELQKKLQVSINTKVESQLPILSKKIQSTQIVYFLALIDHRILVSYILNKTFLDYKLKK